MKSPTSRSLLGAGSGAAAGVLKHHLMLYNRASELELPRLQKRLPEQVLTAAEFGQVIALKSRHL